MSNYTVFGFGYQGQDIMKFLTQVADLGATVVDARLKPFSRNPTWNKSRLMAALGEAYVWEENLGNLHYKGGPTKIKDLQAGLATVKRYLEAGPVIVMCVCKDATDCHRSDILAALRAEGIHTTELSTVYVPPGKPQTELF